MNEYFVLLTQALLQAKSRMDRVPIMGRDALMTNGNPRELPGLGGWEGNRASPILTRYFHM